MSWVYVILEETQRHFVKVGFTSNLKRRIRDLQTGNPDPLVLVAKVRSSPEAYRSLERDLHEKLRNHRVRGEWFDAYQEVRSIVIDHFGNVFVAVSADAVQFCGRDSDGVPEFSPVSDHFDFDVQDCCPSCRCVGRMAPHDHSDGLICCECNEVFFDHEVDEC
jgi:Meiotically up-regulated gene 113